MSPYFTNRPLTVEARQIHSADWGSCQDIAVWCHGEIVDLDDFHASHDLAVIYMPDIEDYAEEGDWIVQFSTREFHVYSDLVFRSNFDEAVRIH